MWSGRHTDSVEYTARAIAEEIGRVRAGRRAAAVAYGREQVERSRRTARDTDAAERQRLAVLGQLPRAARGRRPPLFGGEPGAPGTRMPRMSDAPARWSQATVHPDMWADPDDDPRDSEGAGPDGEFATLQGFLADYRMTLRMKCEGLDAEQLARRSARPSTMSLLGLVRHLAEVERDWRNWIGDGAPLPKLYGARDADFDAAVAEQAAVDAAYADLEREQAATDAALAAHPDLGERVGKDGIAVRALMVHRIEEYARHCGHADLLRERIDGRVGQ